MKFDFNALFNEKLSETLNKLLKPLQARLDTLEGNQLTEDDRATLEVVNESSLQDYDLQDFYSDFDDIRDRCRSVENHIEEYDIESMYCDISDHEGRISELEGKEWHTEFADHLIETKGRLQLLEKKHEHLIKQVQLDSKRISELEAHRFAQDQNDANTARLEHLEKVVSEQAEMIMNLENFLIKIFKDFK